MYVWFQPSCFLFNCQSNAEVLSSLPRLHKDRKCRSLETVATEVQVFHNALAWKCTLLPLQREACQISKHIIAFSPVKLQGSRNFENFMWLEPFHNSTSSPRNSLHFFFFLSGYKLSVCLSDLPHELAEGSQYYPGFRHKMIKMIIPVACKNF